MLFFLILSQSYKIHISKKLPFDINRIYILQCSDFINCKLASRPCTEQYSLMKYRQKFAIYFQLKFDYLHMHKNEYKYGNYRRECTVWTWKINISSPIDLLISSTFSTTTFQAPMRLVWVIGCQSILNSCKFKDRRQVTPFKSQETNIPPP